MNLYARPAWIRTARLAMLAATAVFPLAARGRTAAPGVESPPQQPGTVLGAAPGGSAMPGVPGSAPAGVAPGGAPATPGTPGAAPASNESADAVLDQILPEVMLQSVPLEDVIDYLQDTAKGFRAVVVRRGVEAPVINLKLKNVSLGQVLDVIVTANPNVEIQPVPGPKGPVHVISVTPPAVFGGDMAGGFGGAPAAGAGLGPPGMGMPGVEPERAIRVYRLAGIVEGQRRGEKDPKAALNDVLSLIKAAMQLTDPREAPTIQIHEETQTLLFKGSRKQQQALEDVLSALESDRAVRGEPGGEGVDWKGRAAAANAEYDKARAEAERMRARAEALEQESRSRQASLEAQLQQLNAQLRERELMLMDLKMRMDEKKPKQ